MARQKKVRGRPKGSKGLKPYPSPFQRYLGNRHPFSGKATHVGLDFKGLHEEGMKYSRYRACFRKWNGRIKNETFWKEFLPWLKIEHQESLSEPRNTSKTEKKYLKENRAELREVAWVLERNIKLLGLLECAEQAKKILSILSVTELVTSAQAKRGTAKDRFNQLLAFFCMLSDRNYYKRRLLAQDLSSFLYNRTDAPFVSTVQDKLTKQSKRYAEEIKKYL